MHPGLEPGIYVTKAGSTVTVGKNGGKVAIDFDWFEEDACCDAEPFVLEGALHWACECHGDGSADLVLLSEGAAKAIRVVCDESNNPPEKVAQGIATADVEVDIKVAESHPLDLTFSVGVESVGWDGKVLPPDEPRPVITDIVSSCVKHGILKSEDVMVVNGRRWCHSCIVDLLLREGVCEVIMKRVDK